MTIHPADHRKPAQLRNFTSAHLGKFDPALTHRRIFDNDRALFQAVFNAATAALPKARIRATKGVTAGTASLE